MTIFAIEPEERTRGKLHPPPEETLAAQVDVSIIAVHYRQPELLERMLAGLAPGEVKFEVIIVNASPEIEVAVPRGLPYPARLITARNRGYAYAVNKGLALARGELVAACNVDIDLTARVLTQAVDYMRGHPGTGVLAPDLVYPDGAKQYSARRFYTWWVAAWARLPWRSRMKPPLFYRAHLMMDEPAVGPREVDWAVGAMLVVRRDALARPDEIFDPRYRLYFEDVDLCLDMWKRGWKVVQLPNLRIVHRYSRASRKAFSAAGLHHAVSFVKFALKHRGLPQKGA